MIRREEARLHKYFDGISSMDKHPAAMFVVDIKREHNAVAEARKLKIPIVALVDTNSDPDLVTYPIAANDDAIRSVRMIMATDRARSSRRRRRNLNPSARASRTRRKPLRQPSEI